MACVLKKTKILEVLSNENDTGYICAFHCIVADLVNFVEANL
jgi:hypothetical protein